MIKRVISIALALMLALACFAGVIASAEPASYTAKLGFANSDWSAQEWGDNANTTVTGAGDYSISWNGAASNALVFVVDIAGAGADFAAAGLKLSALSVVVDGVEIPVDLSKVVTGDLENNGNFRIEIYNEYGSTKENAPVDPAAVSFATNLTINFTLSGPATYDAKLGFANSDWSAQEWGDNAKTTVSGAGNYSVSWNGAASNALVFVVDIVGAGADFAAESLGVTALSVVVDGVELPVDLSKVVTGDLENNGNFRIEIYNEYGSTKENAPVDPAAVTFTTNLTVNFTIGAVEQAPEGPQYDLFIAFGGDRAEANDWKYTYYGVETADSAGITVVNAKIGVGQTATVSLTFAEAPLNAYFFAPCLVGTGIADQIGDIDFDITCKINGEDVVINMEADSDGRTWWTEGTGDYAATDCIRLAGAYNEWGAKYIEKPETIISIEYTITINAISEPVAPGEEVETNDEYELFIGYGGDKAAENDWGWVYEGVDVEGITAVKSTIKAGETATISLTFATPVVNSWWFAPCLVGEDVSLVSTVDFTVVCKIDGVEVPINMGAAEDGATWWTEGTGSYTGAQCIRLAGGYNEWGTKYIEKPAGFTTIEYTITLNSVKETTPVDEEPVIVEIDKNGTYNAYLMLQTPNWTFRNAHDDAYYGMEGSSWEALGLKWGQYLVHQDHPGETWGKVSDAVIAGNGTYSVSITDFGTIFADDFAAAGQEYFNIIAISTDLPAGANVTITDVQLYVDGQMRHEYAEAYINSESTSLQILIQNIWNADVKELNYYPAPTQSLEIRFTIAGFDYDKAEEKPSDPAEPTTPAEPTEPNAPVDPAEPTSPVVGIVIAAVVVVALVVVVVVVLKKKKA